MSCQRASIARIVRSADCEALMTLYMKTTTDKFELPVAVADSINELAQILGRTPGTVASCISRRSCGYHRIEIPEDMWADNDGRLWYYGKNSEVIYVD